MHSKRSQKDKKKKTELYLSQERKIEKPSKVDGSEEIKTRISQVLVAAKVSGRYKF